MLNWLRFCGKILWFVFLTNCAFESNKDISNHIEKEKTQTTQPDVDPTSMPSSLSNIDEEVEREVVAKEVAEKIETGEEVAETELSSEGFCKDDIYTKYLKKKYYSENKRKKYKSRRSQKRYDRKRELAALNYAVRTLTGPVSPYFGGIPVVAHEKVEYWIRYFKTNGRKTFLKWLVRGESLRKILEPILDQEGMPQELIYLAMVESGFNNRAFSRARATGTWQFMSGTAKRYGLSINYWMDERRDPAKSTLAATRLLKDLYRQFGDWYLAMAAYNAGPGKVRRAIRRVGSRDFWTIAKTGYLRAETKHYVPKMLAALTLAANSEQHGFREVKANPLNEIPSTTVKIEQPVMLKELAQFLDIPLKLIKHWNPELIRGITPPLASLGNKPYYLRIPQSYTGRFNDVLPKLSSVKIEDVLLHKVRSGDTLYGLSRQYKVSVRSILRFNPKLSPRRLRIGKRVAIPVPSVVTQKKKLPPSDA